MYWNMWAPTCSFSFCMSTSIASSLKKNERKIIHWYTEANNEYMKNNDKNKEPLYLKHWDKNNLLEWAMSQKLPVDGFKCLKNFHG